MARVTAIFLAVALLHCRPSDAAEAADAEVGPAALREDDECATAEGPTGSRPECALSALQLRRQMRPRSNEEEPEEPDDEPDRAALCQNVSMEDGGSVSTYEELKYAVESSKCGARIEVVNRSKISFKGTLNINGGTNFDIWSHGAVLDGENRYGRVRLFYVRGNLSLTNFLLKNGKTDYAGGVYFDFDSNGNITNCSFVHNQATYVGGAIVAKGAALTLDNVNFHYNSAKNTCLSGRHCSRRRRNSRKGNAVYILSHTAVSATLYQQPKSQDFYFDKDFDGSAVFHCARPAMKATAPRVAKHHVHMEAPCTLPERQHHAHSHAHAEGEEGE